MTDTGAARSRSSSSRQSKSSWTASEPAAGLQCAGGGLSLCPWSCSPHCCTRGNLLRRSKVGWFVQLHSKVSSEKSKIRKLHNYKSRGEALIQDSHHALECSISVCSRTVFVFSSLDRSFVARWKHLPKLLRMATTGRVRQASRPWR